jgi:uncharacterized repeat protein (TIGR01451 family)
MHAAHTGAHTDESNREVLAMPPVMELATLRWRMFVNIAPVLAMLAALAFAGSAAAQTLGKAFSPTTIAGGGTTTLTFTVTNPAGAPAVSNVGFVDTLPSGLRVATPAAVGGTCANAAAATIANAGAGTITTSNLQVPAGAASCTVTVNVTNASGQVNASCAGDPAAFTNSVENVGVTNVVNVVTPVCISMTSPSATAVAIPTLGQWVLMLLAMLVAGVAARQRRWR